MNKKGKTLKAYLYVVYMRIGKGEKAQKMKSFKGGKGFKGFKGYLNSVTARLHNCTTFLRTVAGFVFLFNK
jgi:hypothetical protein